MKVLCRESYKILLKDVKKYYINPSSKSNFNKSPPDSFYF